jgi:hypothetical protein
LNSLALLSVMPPFSSRRPGAAVLALRLQRGDEALALQLADADVVERDVVGALLPTTRRS